MTSDLWIGLSIGWLAGWFLSVPIWLWIQRQRQ